MLVGEAIHDCGLNLCLLPALLRSCPVLVAERDPSFFCWVFDGLDGATIVELVHALSVSTLVVGALWGRRWVWCWDLLLVIIERSSSAPNATLASALDLAFTTTWI